MSWSEEHAGASGNRLVWMLVVEGLPYVWVSEGGEQRAFTLTVGGSPDTSVQVWMSGYLHGREVRPGLIADAMTVGCSLDPGTWQLRDDQVSFRIRDLDGSLALLFGREPDGEEVQILRQTIEAGTEALSTVTIPNGTEAGGSLDVTGKHIGIEAIGPSGERNYRPCLPVEMPGPRHYALAPDVDTGAPNITITDDPLVFEGRRVTLWALWPDKDALDQDDATNWGTWLDHFESRRSLVWWGKLRDRPSVGADRVWSIPCNGPSSWLDKQLNVGPWINWLPVTPGSITLEDDEVGFAVRWHADVNGYGTNEYYESSRWDSALELPTSGTAGEYEIAINASITAVAYDGDGNFYTSAEGLFGDGPDGTGPDAPFGENNLELNALGVVLRTRAWSPGEVRRVIHVGLCLHEHVWASQGFNVWAHQKPSVGGVGFVPYADETNRWAPGTTPPDVSAPGDGYWVLVMHTGNDEGVVDAIWERDVPNGATVIREGSTLRLSHEVRLGLNGQHLQAPSSTAVIDVDSTGTSGDWVPDRMRLFAARGKLTVPKFGGEPGETDELETTQVFVGEWQDDNGCIRESDLGAALYVRRWVDPRIFGVDNPPLSELLGGTNPVWISDSIEVVPIGTVGRPTHADYRGSRTAFMALMASTGTSPGFVGNTLVPGSNTVRDIEVAEFGLAIPEAMIQNEIRFRSVLTEAQCSDGSALRWWRYSRIGPFSSLDVLESMIGGVGLGWSLDQHRYQVFNRFEIPSHEDVVVEILQEDTETPSQGAPIGRFAEVELAFRGDLDGGLTDKYRIQARDRGAGSRQRLVHRIVDAGLMPRVPNALNWDWPLQADQRWAVEAAEFWGRRLFMVQRVTVPADKALRLRVGSVLRFTHPAVVDTASGTYGVTSVLARVMSWKLGPFARATLDLLVYTGTQPGAQPVWAPMALTVARGYDSSTRRLLLQRDPCRTGDPSLDPTRGFVRPSWAAALGGDAGYVIQLYEQDRAGLCPIGPTGVVESVDADACALVIAAPGLSPAPKRDKTYWVIGQTYANQEVWAQQLYGYVTDPDCTHSSGVAGKPLR